MARLNDRLGRLEEQIRPQTGDQVATAEQTSQRYAERWQELAAMLRPDQLAIVQQDVDRGRFGLERTGEIYAGTDASKLSQHMSLLVTTMMCGHDRDRPQIITPEIGDALLEDDGPMSWAHECADCGLRLPVRSGRWMQTHHAISNRVFTECPSCGGYVGYAAFSDRQGREVTAS